MCSLLMAPLTYIMKAVLVPSIEAQAVNCRGAGHGARALPDLLGDPSVIVLVISLLMPAQTCEIATLQVRA